jgi:RES domain-containing protein
MEAQQAFPFKAQPLTLCAYDVDCDDMLDLTDPATLTAHGIKAADLACAWKDHESRGLTPSSWIIARDLTQKGIAGILALSYAAGATGADRNAVFWNWGPQPPHQVKVIDDEQRLRAD